MGVWCCDISWISVLVEVSNTLRRPSVLPTATCGCVGCKAQQQAASLPILISHMDCWAPSCHMATAPSAAAVQNWSCLWDHIAEFIQDVVDAH